MKVLDTTVLIDLINGVPEVKSVVSSQDLYTTQVNMYEVIQGLFLKNVSKKKFLLALQLFKNIGVLPLHDAATIQSADISAQLIRKGKQISNEDCLTAGNALSHGITTVVTRNVKHFKRVPGLKVQTY